ncbi:hypothetical protein [Natrarchaeobius chitinivorans]|uniref:Uncharacterized protein n=1 Tax=Natrarchaeobius chitinivorans TaxID=1679083 RepID=A0A3N6LW81_NATCH|nr:hypothetical protein [Natrarchaeobius chitinivorans]RQG94848.1 hypothetical protein EA473_10130 [Natrarchaeobius chitinivorans]
MAGANTQQAEEASREPVNVNLRWGPNTIVQVLLGIWAVWWTIVFATNFFDGLINLGVLGEGWTFASGNYGFLLMVTDVHGTPEALVALLFAGGVLWELLIALLMWQALVGALSGTPSREHVYRAFVVAIGFFGAFMIMTEVFIAYDLANTHVRLLIATLVSLFVVDRFLN